MAIKRDQPDVPVLQAMRKHLMKPAPLREFCQARTWIVNDRAIAQSDYTARKGLLLKKSCYLRRVEHPIRKTRRSRKRSTL